MSNTENLLKYELHCHTHYSLCSGLTTKKLLKMCYKRNLDGVAVTDHNSTEGNLKVQSLNKKMAKSYHKDFEVILANEIKTQFGDVLVYFMTEEIKTTDFYEVADIVKEQGALMFIAHPFRALKHLSFKKDISKVQKLITGIEVYNGRTGPEHNQMALDVAQKLNLPKTVGSDAHFSYEVGRCQTLCKENLKKSILKKKVEFRYSPRVLYFTSTLGTFQTLFRKRLINKYKIKRNL